MTDEPQLVTLEGVRPELEFVVRIELDLPQFLESRSEERRVGKECVP